MFRRILTTASSARAPSTAPVLKLPPPPAWQSTPSRLFTTTPRPSFKSTPAPRDASPFRLSTNKPESSSSSPPQTFEDVYYSPYQPKRQWPPDMSKLSAKHQFRLERKYRRRAALKYARPKFMKIVTLGQWVIIGFVIIYSVLFMEWETNDTPFHGIREQFFAGLRSVFSSAPPPTLKRDQKDETSSGGGSQ
ncbi:hypothetical protein N7535_006554 [Penicillium sp. DV-2018c]|nr:hypothetical protein N7461_007362 [Penicillium sp. DV-2018c]KAJ5567248.1 hypothetical protein N7535_006554 [Penicillium sp. DV-2018c]